MKRLTHERSNGIKTGYWSPNKKDELVEALVAYENTGLTPGEIREMRENRILAEMDQRRRDKDELLQELKEAVKPKWIPIEERLPEVGRNVLVQWERYDRFTGTISVYFDTMWLDDGEEIVFEAVGGIPNGKVIAWRPLPEPWQAS